jgi:GMP synthase (glutamine-hydrolysing)
MRPLILIGHAEWENFGVAPAALHDAGVPFVEHLAHTGADLPDLTEISGIVLYGGEMNVDMSDRYPFLSDERIYVRKAIDAGVPYLGICLGAQMLARALDHPVHPAGVREFGFNALRPTALAAGDELLSVFEDGDMVFHWHEDTFRLPEGATLLGTGDEVPLQAFRYGSSAWGMQFHFEVDRGEVELWLETAGEDVVRAWGKTTEQVLDETDRHIEAHEARGREMFRRFANVARRSAA